MASVVLSSIQTLGCSLGVPRPLVTQLVWIFCVWKLLYISEDSGLELYPGIETKSFLGYFIIVGCKGLYGWFSAWVDSYWELLNALVSLAWSFQMKGFGGTVWKIFLVLHR